MSGWRAVEWLLCMPARTSFKRKHDIQKVVPHIFSIHISRCPTSFRHLSSPSFWPQVAHAGAFQVCEFLRKLCAWQFSLPNSSIYIYMFIFSWDVVKLLFDLFLSCSFFNSSYSNWFEFSGVKWLSDHALKAMLRPCSERKPASKHHDTVTFQCDVLCPTSLIFSIVFGPLNSCILFVWHNLRQCNSYIYICT